MLSNRLTKNLNEYFRYLRPAQQCLLCGMSSGEQTLCFACWQDLPWLAQPQCPRCAAPTGGDLCGACLKHPPQFDATRAALRYDFPIAELLHAYKYRGQANLSYAFAAMLRAHAPEEARNTDVLVPLPVTLARMRERGFNQAAELAKLLGRALNVSVALYALRKTRETRPQIELPWDERRANVRGAFACDTSVAGLNVALIDDVMTTGASADAASGALKQAGARSVVVWVLARTLRP